MNTKVIIGVIVAVIVILLIILLAFGTDKPIIDDNNNDLDINGAEQVLLQLPYEITVGERTVVFDSQTLEQTSRTEYSQTNPPIAMQTGEDPIEYIERYLREVLDMEFVQDQPEFFNYEVSFYPFAGQGEVQGREGVSVFVRVMNIPDDSVGGAEARFDFLLIDGDWEIDWYGERVFCRRMDAEFWQSADQLCP